MMLADLNPAMTMMGAQHGYGATAQHTVSGHNTAAAVHCGTSGGHFANLSALWGVPGREGPRNMIIGASRHRTIITALLPYYHYLFVDSGRQIILKAQ